MNRRIINKDEEAVSPVIAVILMVAITVVMAAVLYAWLGGIIGGSPKSPPTGSMMVESVISVSGEFDLFPSCVDRIHFP